MGKRLRGVLPQLSSPVHARLIRYVLSPSPVGRVSICDFFTQRQTPPHGRGVPVLDRNPVAGVKLPVEKNPRRQVETYERYLALMEVAPLVDWRLPAALHITESYGRRIGGTVKTRRDDLDLDREPYGWIRFRAANDKAGHEQWVPLTEESRLVITRHLDQLPEGTPWLFPPRETCPSRWMSR